MSDTSDGSSTDRDPFAPVATADDLVVSTALREAVDELREAFEGGAGLACVTGEAGVGKSALALKLRSELADSFSWVEIDDPLSLFEGVEAVVDSAIDAAGAARQRVIVAIESAQSLSPSTLEKLGEYLDGGQLEAGSRPVLLLARTPLPRTLESFVRGRESQTVELEGLDRAATEEYVKGRLAASGHPASFADDAFDEIQWRSNGLPLGIDRLCRSALSLVSGRDESASIDAALVRDADSAGVGSMADAIRGSAGAPVATGSGMATPAATGVFSQALSRGPEASETGATPQDAEAATTNLMSLTTGIHRLPQLEPPAESPERTADPSRRRRRTPPPRRPRFARPLASVAVLGLVAWVSFIAGQRSMEPERIAVPSVSAAPPLPDPGSLPSGPPDLPLARGAAILEGAFAALYGTDQVQVIELYEIEGEVSRETDVLRLARKRVRGELRTVGVLQGEGDREEARIFSIERPGGADDRSVYLPESGDVVALDPEAADPFDGTHFGFDDFRPRTADDYLVSQLKQLEFAGEPVYVVTATPRYPAAYQRIDLVVADSDRAILERRFYRENDLSPYRIAQSPRSEIQQIGALALPTLVVAKNLDTGSEAEARVSGLFVGAQLEDEFFERERLSAEELTIPAE